ncbi:MAG: hypothetical protein JSU92_06405, partial [Deltaproteobacteria bacterium]
DYTGIAAKMSYQYKTQEIIIKRKALPKYINNSTNYLYNVFKIKSVILITFLKICAFFSGWVKLY